MHGPECFRRDGSRSWGSPWMGVSGSHFTRGCSPKGSKSAARYGGGAVSRSPCSYRCTLVAQPCGRSGSCTALWRASSCGTASRSCSRSGSGGRSSALGGRCFGTPRRGTYRAKAPSSAHTNGRGVKGRLPRARPT